MSIKTLMKVIIEDVKIDPDLLYTIYDSFFPFWNGRNYNIFHYCLFHFLFFFTSNKSKTPQICIFPICLITLTRKRWRACCRRSATLSVLGYWGTPPHTTVEESVSQGKITSTSARAIVFECTQQSCWQHQSVLIERVLGQLPTGDHSAPAKNKACL